MAHIDYYFAAISPFTYLAGQRLEAIAAKYHATITYKPLDPMALFPRTGGQVPKDRHPSRMAYRAQELRRWSAVLGMPLNLKPTFWPTNPAPASYAIIAAQKVGGGDLGGFVHAITRACWAEQRNVAEDDVIFPPGYERAIISSLAVEIAPEYQKTVSPELAAIQRASKAAIKRLNTREPISRTDLSTRGIYNINSDE
jgi:2-hydroxychromene-2-carboxylate isomerase